MSHATYVKNLPKQTEDNRHNNAELNI